MCTNFDVLLLRSVDCLKLYWYKRNVSTGGHTIIQHNKKLINQIDSLGFSPDDFIVQWFSFGSLHKLNKNCIIRNHNHTISNLIGLNNVHSWSFPMYIYILINKMSIQCHFQSSQVKKNLWSYHLPVYDNPTISSVSGSISMS